MSSAIAYSYLRFSTPEQSQGDSFNRQIRLARDYALLHGLTLDEKLTFQDLGVSAFRGKNMEDGHLGQFLEAVKSRLVAPGSYLLVESLDRISRQKARKALRTLEAIVDEGVAVVTLVDGRVYTEESLNDDPTSLIMSILIFIRANEESQRKSERLQHAWRSKREAASSSRPLTKNGPGWLRLVDGAWEIIPERADVVRRMFEMSAGGIGANGICSALNAESTPTFGSGMYWQMAVVQRILTLPSAMGTFMPHKQEYRDGRKLRVPQEPVPNYFPAVIEPELWDAAQQVLHSRNPRRGRHSAREVQNLFGGLIRCGRCGGSVTRKAGRTNHYLVCMRAKTGAGCTYGSVLYDHVERVFVNGAPAAIAAAPAGIDLDAEIQEARRAEMGIGQEVEDLYDELLKLDSPGDREVPRKLIAKKTAVLEEIRAELKELLERADVAQGRLVQKRLEDLQAVLTAEPLDRTAANAVMRQALEKIVMDYDTGEFVLHWRHGGESRCWYTTEAINRVAGAAAAN